MNSLRLTWPDQDLLAGYVAALQRGWSPDNIRGQAAALEELAHIERDAAGFIAAQVDPEGRGEPVQMPDGSQVPRLPGYRRWLHDSEGEFCGVISFRWQAGSSELPPYCLGHIGYAVVPWKRRLGHATAALRLLLPEAKARGLSYVELTTDLDNRPSQQVIEANGGVLLGSFAMPAVYGKDEVELRWRITL